MVRSAFLCAVVTPAAWPAEFAVEALRNWHQWRGPLATGEAPEGDPPVRWDEATNVRWKIELPGTGSGTPVVWGEHVFVLTAVETERIASEEELAALRAANEGQKTEPAGRYYRFLVMAVDRANGNVQWQRTACETLPHEGIQPTNTYASASAITDGRHVYASFGSYGIYCYDLAGELVWRRDMGDMRTRYGWGEGASPALFSDTLYVNWDHEGESFLFALDANTGDVRWRTPRDEPTSWATPLVVPREGRTQVIVPATNEIRSYDAATGELIWQCDGLTTNVIASPIPTDESVICMSWYGEAAVKAISLGGVGNVTDSEHVLWTYDRLAPYCPSPLLVEDELFMVRANTGVFVVLDPATGQEKVGPARLPGMAGEMYASPVAAAGRIYFVGRDGTAVVLQHADEPETHRVSNEAEQETRRVSKGLELLSVNRLDDGFDASPAIVDGQMFLRGRRFLYCLEERP